VIGQYPVLDVDDDDDDLFRYQSCTYASTGSTGSGSFVFGQLSPLQGEFEVAIPQFTLVIPECFH
jgi:uncharacterized protein affecting Mg2+/Co2+ transport